MLRQYNSMKYTKHTIYALIAINMAFLLGVVYRLYSENKMLKSFIESGVEARHVTYQV